MLSSRGPLSGLAWVEGELPIEAQIGLVLSYIQIHINISIVVRDIPRGLRGTPDSKTDGQSLTLAQSCGTAA